MDSTINRKGTIIGAAEGVMQESESFEICLAGAKLDPNMQDTAEEFRNVKLLVKIMMTVLPPRCDATVGVKRSIRGRFVYLKDTGL
jgi:hypothetical protein